MFSNTSQKLTLRVHSVSAMTACLIGRTQSNLRGEIRLVMKSPGRSHTSSVQANCEAIPLAALQLDILTESISFWPNNKGGEAWGGNDLVALCGTASVREAAQVIVCRMCRPVAKRGPSDRRPIVVQRSCCPISHSASDVGIFPLRFTPEMGRANLSPIYPPDCL